MADHLKEKALSGTGVDQAIPHERHRFSELYKFAKKAVRPSGKKGDLIKGIAAVEAVNSRVFEHLGNFHPDKPILEGGDVTSDQDITDDTFSGQVVQVVDRDINPNPSALARQFTSASSVSQQETKTLVEATSLYSPSMLITIDISSTLHTPIKQQSPKDTFLNNTGPPFFYCPLPGPNKRFRSTCQLAFGRHLLLTKKLRMRSRSSDSQVTDEDDWLVEGLEETDRAWIRAMMKDAIEQDRLCGLISQVVCQFLKSNHKDTLSIAEVIVLGPVLDRQDFRRVLSSLILQLEQDPLLDSELLKGIIYFLQSASPGHLVDHDLVSILRVLRKRLEETHMRFDDNNKSASAHVYLLMVAAARVVDAMMEGDVHRLDRTEDHRPLLELLAGLRDSPDLYLNYQATYVWQALQYIGDDESPLHMALRIGGGLARAGLGVASAFSLDIGGLFNGLRELGDAAGQILDATNTVVDSFNIARDSGEGIMNSLRQGFRNGEKRAWYPALQAARVFIREGRVAEFKRLVYEAPCSREIEFQWGVCQLLGEMAMDPIWATETRQQAIYVLEDLYKFDTGWTKDSTIRIAISGILFCIHQNAEKSLRISIKDTLSAGWKQDAGDKGIEPYPLITRLSTLESSPLLDQALMVPSSEYKLHRMIIQQLEELQLPFYIPPYAKAGLRAPAKKCFPLLDKVLEFLASDRQVFLVLGDSGSGKSAFMKHVSTVLMKRYSGGTIPLFLRLPDINNPSTGLVSEHFQTHGFTKEDIQEMKQDRQFVIVCDSYDESQLSINLHTTNMLNRRSQWNAKMIVSCRSTHARPGYLDRFQPQPPDRHDAPTSHLFEEAVIVPFSSNQVKDYVDHFVLHKGIDTVLSIPVIWSASEYMDKLTRIPNLLPLVTNPFLLKLALKSLPVVFKDKNIDPSTITLTRLKLFRIFIEDWLENNRLRLISMNLSKEAKTKLDELIEADFKTIAIDFLQDLAKDIYEKQAGHPVVEYIHRHDKGTWKSKFFGPDEEATLLRQSSPLICEKDLHSFIHQSLYDYFFSLHMTRLGRPPSNAQEDIRGSIINNQYEQGQCHHGVHGSHVAEVAAAAAGPAVIEATDTIAHHKKKENGREEVAHGYVPPVPAPVGGSSDTEYGSTDAHGGGFVHIPGLIGGLDTTATEGSSGHLEYDVLIGGAILGGAAVMTGLPNRSQERTFTSKTTVTRTVNGGRIYTTTCTGGRTAATEYNEMTGSNRHVVTGIIPGTTTIRVITQRTESGEDLLVPVDSPEGEEHEILTERESNGQIRYVIGDRITGAAGATAVRPDTSGRTESNTATKIVTERSSAGEIRNIIVGGFTGNTIRVLTERTSTGEIGFIPTNDEAGELRHVIQERTESGEIRYIIGTIIATRTITRVVMGPRIVTERTSTGDIRHVILDQYNGNTIRTKCYEETGQMIQIPVSAPDGELRYVIEERTATGEIRKVIGGVTTGMISGDDTTEGSSTSTKAFVVEYHDNFGVEWTERETAVSDAYTSEVKTYETFDETEEIEEVVDETEISTEVVLEQVVFGKEKEKEVEVETHTSITTTSEEVVLEHTTAEVVAVEEAKEVAVIKETEVVAKPAVSKGSSWFRRLATGAYAAGACAGAGAAGAVTQVDGVWKRTVQVLTTRKAHVDKICPIAKTSYVYYDDDVYEAVLTEKSTGVTYITQLLYDTTESAYYVYIRWGEIDYKLDGPHETIEAAKSAFQVTYHDKFGVQWTERETTLSEAWIYEVKTYETFEETEEIEEVVDETEISAEVVREQAVVEKEKEVEVETYISTTTSSEELTHEHTTTEVVAVDEDNETVVVMPAVSKGSSWFRHLAAGAGAVVASAGVSVAGAAAAGAMNRVDGVWKRTVQVLTTRKAHVDKICPIAKTSYVYYDDDVYDAVLIERSTGVTYVTQLLYDATESAYYVYIRWGEIDYKLDGPHETTEAAKSAFQVTYHDKFGVQWTERETTLSEAWSYEVKAYETFEETEEIEEVVEESEISTDTIRQTVDGQNNEVAVVTSIPTTTTTAEDYTAAEEYVTLIESDCDDDSTMSNGTSRYLLEFKMSRLPPSLGDLTMESLVSEMKTSPVFDDQTLGSVDLEEEPDILVFLVDRVFEEPVYTKRLMWTVYKLSAEGVLNQSTKNAKRILEMAGIHWRENPSCTLAPELPS